MSENPSEHNNDEERLPKTRSQLGGGNWIPPILVAGFESGDDDNFRKAYLEYVARCEEINRRLLEIGVLLERGLHEEASELVEIEPNLLEMVRKWDLPPQKRAQLLTHVQHLDLPPPPELHLGIVNKIVETITLSSLVQSLEEREPLPQQDIQALWSQYKSDPTCRTLRNQLMAHYFPLVKYHGERVWSRLPEGVELDDLISAGIFGLMDAINVFDLSRGVKFETYCASRIRGAMLDELRAMDWVPRLVRAKASKLLEATNSLEKSLGRTATDQEIASYLEISLPELEKFCRDARDAPLSERTVTLRKLVDADPGTLVWQENLEILLQEADNKEEAMESNTKIILKMVLLIALPIGALSFLFSSVVPKRMGLEKEARDTLMICINGFSGVLSPILCAFYAMNRVRHRNAAERENSGARLKVETSCQKTCRCRLRGRRWGLCARDSTT